MNAPFKFTAEDFKDLFLEGALAPAAMAERANSCMQQWLAAAPVVYANNTDVRKEWFGGAIRTVHLEGDTHTARLVAIEEIKK